MAAEIFIVGADSTTGRMIEDVLKAVGYKVRCFQGVPQALVGLDPQNTQLIFIDTASTGTDLSAEMEEIQQRAPLVEMILIADYQDPLIEEDARKHHIGNWLYRPFKPQEIILKVFSALEGASLLGPDGIPLQPNSNHQPHSLENKVLEGRIPLRPPGFRLSPE
jgi:DNA-binding NtrC family response regulator